MECFVKVRVRVHSTSDNTCGMLMPHLWWQKACPRLVVSLQKSCSFIFCLSGAERAAVVSHSPWREDGTTRSKVWEYFLSQWSTGDGPVALLAQGVW